MVKDNDFLKKVYEIDQNKILFYMEIEYKLLNMFLIVYPIIVTSVVGISQYIDKKLTLILTIFMSILLFVMTIFIHKKVHATHKTITDYGNDIKNIWEYFDMFSKDIYLNNKVILDNDARNIGHGDGHKKTLNILWAMTIITSVGLLIFGFFNFTI